MNKRVRIVITDHARSQIRMRSLSKSEVIETVRHPDKLFEQRPARFRAIRSFRQTKKPYLLVVVFDLLEKELRIVTAFQTSKVEKYQ